MNLNKLFMIGAACAASLLVTTPVMAETTIAKIKRTGTISLGYREESKPFSFVGADKQPAGYSIDLCRIVADDLGNALKLPKLKVQWVPVTAKTRFDALTANKIDLECGNTTQTITRRANFDFSLMTYVDGAGLLFRKGEEPQTRDALKGQRITVVAGTTTEKALEQLNQEGQFGITIIKVADHAAGLKAVNDKTATGYAADRTVLITAGLASGNDYALSNVQLSYEPYGLMMRRDADFRLAVDSSLARLYRSGAIGPIFDNWFAALGNPGEALKVMFLLNGLPE